MPESCEATLKEGPFGQVLIIEIDHAEGFSIPSFIELSSHSPFFVHLRGVTSPFPHWACLDTTYDMRLEYY